MLLSYQVDSPHPCNQLISQQQQLKVEIRCFDSWEFFSLFLCKLHADNWPLDNYKQQENNHNLHHTSP